MNLEELLDEVLRHMVEHSVNGVYHGSPRPIMERFGVSSGPLYDRIQEMGIVRQGRGSTGRWHIPPDVLEQYR
jgi:hypothetical protein